MEKKNVPNHQPVIDDNADALFLRMIMFNWAYISYLVGSNQNNPGNPILLWTSTSNVDLSEYYLRILSQNGRSSFIDLKLSRTDVAEASFRYTHLILLITHMYIYIYIHIYSNFHHAHLDVSVLDSISHYIYIYIYIYIPAPGLPRVCFVMFSRVFMMTFMFISWYLQDLWSNHHLFWSQNVVNFIVFYFFIIFHWYLHAFVNARSRKRLFQDALFFDGFAFRHRKTTKNLDFSLFFWRSSFTACSLEESRLSNGSDWHRHCFPSAIAIVWRTATTVGSVLRLCELQCC